MSIKLSVILPSYKDPYSVKTIGSLLLNSELGEGLEVIQVFDGYWPDFALIQDPRVRYVHLGANRGMRGAINAGVDVARGEFLARSDEHCMYSKGWDKILTDDCPPNAIISPRRYFLDPEKWEIMNEHGYIDYEKLVIQDCGNGVKKFAGQKWRSRTEERQDILIDENQAIQGSLWVMPHEWWNKVVGQLDTENYGPLIQDSVEVCMKTWQAGGKLLINKKAWYAHKHRSFSRTHNNGTKDNPAQYEKGYKYALDQYEDYYKNVLLPKWNEQQVYEKPPTLLQ